MSTEQPSGQARQRDQRHGPAHGLVHLVGVGYVPAVRADQLCCGDEVMWDYGSRTKVVGIRPGAGRQLVLSLAAGAIGTPYPRTVADDAAVAGIRFGAWLGGAPVTGMVCRVPVHLRDLTRECGTPVDETGRCESGHFPPVERVAVERPQTQD